MNMRIRTAKESDLESMRQLFADSIIHVCKADYTPAQLKAWAAGARQTQKWLDRLYTQLVLVAELDEEIAGFASLGQQGYLDLFYVHKDQQRKGVAKALYSSIETAAMNKSEAKIWANVSKTARPFFEKMGFVTIKENTVIINAVALHNFHMEKLL